MPFYSHSDKTLLSSHCYAVAEKAKNLVSSIHGVDADAAFWAGLFHDTGKLNPYYQVAFTTGRGPRDAPPSKYIPMHAPFSAFATENYLQLGNKQTIAKAVSCIHGHHSRLAKEPYRLDDYRGSDAKHKVKIVLDEIESRLPDFWKEVSQMAPTLQENIDDAAKLKWREGMRYLITTTKDTGPALFFEMGVLFSALLQADRGSFGPWETPHFDVRLDTNILIAKDKKDPLDNMRSTFQSDLAKRNDFLGQVMVLEAPTGIGKTKLFLDITNKLSKQRKLERVYYFSPLLALTDDFEKKLSKAVGPLSTEVLVYNHIFKGTLQAKEEQRLASERATSKDEVTEMEEEYEELGWNFKVESFNKKFIVTTTQRLLLTLFSNYHKDKLKLLSLKNSILILDEVQMIPRALLPATVELLSMFAKRAGSVVLLVSATVPAALAGYQRLQTSTQLQEEYLSKTKKRVLYLPDAPLSVNGNKALIMLNTRKKAFEYAKKAGCDFYITSGIRKADRMGVIDTLNKTANARVVATQVIEAGVDISFDAVYRELAPLDSIVQVMGRLNREAKEEDAVLTVFNKDNNPVPYGNLEFELSKKFFEKHQETNSMALLHHLRNSYYPELDNRNKTMQEDIQELDGYICEQRFSEVYQFVRRRIGEESYSVYVPRTEIALSRLISAFLDKRRLPLNELNSISANFPASASKKHKDIFDKRLTEHGIYAPREGTLNEFYDERFGLDIWLGK